MKYKDGNDFERDLFARLNERARSVDELKDLKLQLVTDRILARFDTDDLIVEGGAAAKYHAPPTAHTKDVDAVISDKVVKELGLDKMEPEQRAEFLQQWVHEHVRQSAGDFLKLRCDQASPITDLREGEPCVRAWISAELNRQEFLPLFEMDLALQDKPIPTVTMQGRDILDFADVEKPEVQVMCPEYLIADKLTLYLKENVNPEFERPNDIAHMAALIDRCDLDADRLTEGLAAFAIQRDVVNELIERIPDPQYEKLEDRFQEAILDQSKIEISMPQAMQVIRETIEPVRDRAFDLALEILERGESGPSLDKAAGGYDPVADLFDLNKQAGASIDRGIDRATERGSQSGQTPAVQIDRTDGIDIDRGDGWADSGDRER